MQHPATFVVAVVLALFALAPAPAATAAAGAGADKAAQSAPSAAPGSARDAAPDVVRATLKNGLRVVIVPWGLAPTVTTQITYLAGSYQAPRDFPGTAHALEHMLFRDAKGLSAAQLTKMTGKMGARSNAFTSADATQYYFVAPAQYTDLLLKIESIRMRAAALSGADWKAERGAVEQEVSRRISRPDYLARAEARRILFAGTGYAETPLGSRPSLAKNTPARLKAFYDHYYRPNNAILVIAGNVDAKATLATVKRLFGDIPKAKIPPRKRLQASKFKPRTIVETTPDGTGTVKYVYRLPGQRSPDYAALQVLLDVLDNARSRLSELAAEGKVLSSGASSQSFTHAGLGFVRVGFAKGADSDKAAAALDAVLQKLRKEGVAPDLVAAAKARRKARYAFAHDSAVRLASSWSQALAWQGLDSLQQSLDNCMAVTVQDVNRVAHKYLKPGQRVQIVLTPDPDGERPSHSRSSDDAEDFAGGDQRHVALPDWAETALGKLQLPNWTLDPVRMRLDNGITLIVQPTSVSQTVTLVGRVDTNADLQAPKGQEGIGRLLDRLFDYGTRKLDREAFHKALDAIAARASAGTGFSLTVPSQHFARGLQLLAANELRPALPKKAFQVQRKKLADTLQGRLQSPRYKMRHALYKGLLPHGDPGLRQATPATVSKLRLRDVKAYYAQVVRPDMTTIVVVGDVTPEQAKAAVTKYFGAWQAHGPKPDVIADPVPVNPASRTRIADPYASRDSVYMGQMLDLDAHDPARYALQLGNLVLGGNGFASRLMQEVRVEHGYAYDIGSGLHFGRSRSVFFLHYGSDPTKLDEVDALVAANLAAMRSKPVSNEELQNAKQAAIRSIPLGVASVRGIAWSLLGWSLKGAALNQPMVAARQYLKLDADAVQAAFKKYLQPDHMVRVVRGPQPEEASTDEKSQ